MRLIIALLPFVLAVSAAATVRQLWLSDGRARDVVERDIAAGIVGGFTFAVVANLLWPVLVG